MVASGMTSRLSESNLTSLIARMERSRTQMCRPPPPPPPPKEVVAGQVLRFLTGAPAETADAQQPSMHMDRPRWTLLLSNTSWRTSRRAMPIYWSEIQRGNSMPKSHRMACVRCEKVCESKRRYSIRWYWNYFNDDRYENLSDVTPPPTSTVTTKECYNIYVGIYSKCDFGAERNKYAGLREPMIAFCKNSA